MPLPMPLTLYTLVDPCAVIPGVPPFVMWFLLDDRGEAVYCHPDQAIVSGAVPDFQDGTVDGPATYRAHAEAILAYELTTMDQVERDYLAASAELVQAAASLEATLNRAEAQLAPQPVAKPTRSSKRQRQGQGWFSRFVADFVVLVGWRRGKPYVRPYLRGRFRLWP